MAQNTFKTPLEKAPPKARRKKGPNRLQRWINEQALRLFGREDAWPMRNLERILWVSLLLTIYIGLNHNAERLVRRMLRARSEVDELRANYTSLQAEFMRSSKQSEISKRVAALGLAEPPVLKEDTIPLQKRIVPLQKIVVKSDEY